MLQRQIGEMRAFVYTPDPVVRVLLQSVINWKSWILDESKYLQGKGAGIVQMSFFYSRISTILSIHALIIHWKEGSMDSLHQNNAGGVFVADQAAGRIRHAQVSACAAVPCTVPL